jgi:hypothetical protein
VKCHANPLKTAQLETRPSGHARYLSESYFSRHFHVSKRRQNSIHMTLALQLQPTERVAFVFEAFNIFSN